LRILTLARAIVVRIWNHTFTSLWNIVSTFFNISTNLNDFCSTRGCSNKSDSLQSVEFWNWFCVFFAFCRCFGLCRVGHFTRHLQKKFIGKNLMQKKSSKKIVLKKAKKSIEYLSIWFCFIKFPVILFVFGLGVVTLDRGEEVPKIGKSN